MAPSGGSACGKVKHSVMSVSCAFRVAYQASSVAAPDPAGEVEDYISEQHCGGFIDAISGNATGWDISGGSGEAKGYICPAPSLCQVST